MSYLAQLRARAVKKENGEGVPPPKPTEPGFVSSVGGGMPPVGNFEGLGPLQEAARQKAVAHLAEHPQVQRAFVTRTEGDVVIVTLAVRDIGTCELAIPAERLASAADWTDFIRCLDQPEGCA